VVAEVSSRYWISASSLTVSRRVEDKENKADLEADLAVASALSATVMTRATTT
jgi:hypothetical protein